MKMMNGQSKRNQLWGDVRWRPANQRQGNGEAVFSQALKLQHVIILIYNLLFID